MTALKIAQIPTSAFTDQKPGTSGLRKRVKTFQQPNYTENFIQAIFNSIQSKDATILVGGDGRYYSKEAIQIIIKIAAGNGVEKLVIAQDGILSTPAGSNLIRKRKLNGGILLTASHNAGGPDNDFGIKYNMSNGGPAPESVTEKIYTESKALKTYNIVNEIPEVDLSVLGVQVFGNMTIEIIDGIVDYVELVKYIFDFDAIRSFLKNHPDFTFLFDAMHAVTGPYAKHIFCEELGLPLKSVINAIPRQDFNNGHPDPNLTYAHELVELVEKHSISFGAASDGDGDRNMIIGKGTFVNPSDSVASTVAEKLNLPIYEVPTGWKYFGNLMDAGKLSICGEESFGTGSDHIREKDGLWAILAWLSIVAESGTSLKAVLNEHYSVYGRNYFSRYDYENVDSEGAEKAVDLLRQYANDSSFVGSTHGDYTVKLCDDFCYTDPIDMSVSKAQGIRIIFTDGSRIVFRLSGTGSHGATVRLYVEKYDRTNIYSDTQTAIQDLIQVALTISKLQEFTGRNSPTVIT